MITAQGIVFLSKTRVQATTAADGTFALTLLAFDRIDTHQVEPWRITYSGPSAKEFWNDHRNQLQPSQPLHVVMTRIRTFTNGRHGAAESHSVAASISLAPHSHEISRKPSPNVREQLPI